MRTSRRGVRAVLCAVGLAVAACGGPEDEAGLATDDVALASTACAFAATAMTFTMTAGQPAVFSLRSGDSAILADGAPCVSSAGVTATASNARKLKVIGTAGADTVILDHVNGLFLPGSKTAVGIELGLSSGANALELRGSKGGELYTAGAGGVSFNNDEQKDISITMASEGTVAIIFSPGLGSDTASGAGGYGTGTPYPGSLLIHGGDGNDTLTGGNGADFIYGGAGNDTIRGGAGWDCLNGEDGADTFEEGTEPTGGDTFHGGAGVDTVTYASRIAGVTISVGDPVSTGEGDDVKADVEVIIGTAFADVLTGDSGANTLNGGAGDDVLSGGDGADILNGGEGDDLFDEGTAANGADTFNGGNGTDTMSYARRVGSGVTVTIDGTANDGATGASEGDNVKVDVENLVGSPQADSLTGSRLANVIAGGAGADVMDGAAGDDVFVEGASGAETGGDSIAGGSGVDTVDYSARAESLCVDMSDGAANDGESGEGDDIDGTVENLLCGAGVCAVTGNAGDNVIVGAKRSSNRLAGGDGNDRLYGGGMDDVLSGGGGDDTLDGGNGGTDTFDCGAGQGDVAIGGTDASCEL